MASPEFESASRRGSMSRGDWLVIVTAAVFVLAGFGGYALVSKKSLPSFLADSSTESNLARVEWPPAIAPPAPPGSVEKNAGSVVTVSRVIDADSIEVSGPVRGPVQILGILAPTGSECHAAESKAYAVSTLRGATVTLIADPSQSAEDRSGCRPAHVALSDGGNYAVLAAGAGAVKYFHTDPPTALADQIKAAEVDARGSNDGLWARPATAVSPSPTAPSPTASPPKAPPPTSPAALAVLMALRAPIRAGG